MNTSTKKLYILPAVVLAFIVAFGASSGDFWGLMSVFGYGGGGGGGYAKSDNLCYVSSLNAPLTISPGCQAGSMTYNPVESSGFIFRFEAATSSVIATTTFYYVEKKMPVGPGSPVDKEIKAISGKMLLIEAKDSLTTLPTTTFLKDFTTTIFTGEIYKNMADTGVYWLNLEGARWEKISTAVFENGKVTFTTQKMGLFAIFTVKGLPNYIPAIPVPEGIVLGASKFYFGRNFGIKTKATGLATDIKELKKVLSAEKLYNFRGTTFDGNFYAILEASVKLYQKKNGITPVTGFVGPKTRLVLNKSSVLGASTVRTTATPYVLKYNTVQSGQQSVASYVNATRTVPAVTYLNVLTTSPTGSVKKPATQDEINQKKKELILMLMKAVESL